MTDRETLAARIEAATGPDLTEQIARALYEADDPWHEAFPWPNPDGLGVAANYRRIAQAVLPFIAAERERCAVIADENATMWRDRARKDREKGRDDALAAMAAAEVKRTAAAIRSQQP